MFDLNILGTHMEASVLFLEPGYDTLHGFKVRWAGVDIEAGGDAAAIVAGWAAAM
jgi:hypothetical protein